MNTTNSKCTFLSKNHQAASTYASKFGWYVAPAKGKVPLTPRGHLDATIEQDQIQNFWKGRPSANVLVAVKPSGIAVLDLDTKPARGISAHDSLIEIQSKYGEIVTPCAFTAGGGMHFYFKTSKPLPRRHGFLPGVDFLGDGLVILPPSTGENGKEYVWDAELHVNDTPLAEVPDWLIKLSGCELEPADDQEPKAKSEGEWIELFRTGFLEGHRNEHLAKVAGHLHRRYVSPTLTMVALDAINAKHCQPPLPRDEVKKISTSIGQRNQRRKNHPRKGA